MSYLVEATLSLWYVSYICFTLLSPTAELLHFLGFQLVDSYGAANNISIQYSRTLESTDQLLHYLEFALTSKCVDGNCWKTELDLVLVDITWANLLSPQLQAIKKADVYADTMLKQVVEFYERPDGDLFAAPLFLDFGVLLYRSN